MHGMKSLWLGLVIGTLASQACAEQPGTVQALVQGNTDFALDLYKRLAAEKGNLFFSPYSISTALAMTYDGARNKTAAEMKNVLHFPLAPEALPAVFGDLVRTLQSQDDA